MARQNVKKAMKNLNSASVENLSFFFVEGAREGGVRLEKRKVIKCHSSNIDIRRTILSSMNSSKFPPCCPPTLAIVLRLGSCET